MSRITDEMRDEIRTEAAFRTLFSLLRKGVISLEDAFEKIPEDKELFEEFLESNGYTQH